MEFDEIDYKGTLNLALPNNDGTCGGTYSYKKVGKVHGKLHALIIWAAGTLKWMNGSVTGSGRL